jgi:hypothetical protein
MITGVLAFSGCDYFGRSHAILFLLERVKLYLLAWCCPKVIENDLLLLQPVHSDDFYDCFRTLRTIQDATYTCHFSDWTKGSFFDVIFLPSLIHLMSFYYPDIIDGFTRRYWQTMAFIVVYPSITQ